MTRRGVLLLAAVIAGAAAAVAPAARADDKAFKIIVNPDNRTIAVDRDFLRDAFLKKVNEWDNGTALRPIGLSTRFAARDQFTQEVLRKSPAQLKAYWNQQIFSGKGTPPPEAEHKPSPPKPEGGATQSPPA